MYDYNHTLCEVRLYTAERLIYDNEVVMPNGTTKGKDKNITKE